MAPDGRIDWVVTNNLDHTVNRFVAELKNDNRWQVEDFHRGFKQLTGSEKCQCRKGYTNKTQKISGLSFPEYVKKNILEKLSLNRTSFDTYFYIQDYEGRDGRFARGYIKNEERQIVEKNRYKNERIHVTLSAGGMWASATDLLKFDRAIFSGKLFDKKLLKPMTAHHVFTGWEGTYFGYVFNIINVNTNKEGVGHAGNSSGHHSFNFHYENRNTTLIILTNYGFIDIFELAHGQIEPILLDE